jgi:hypothetical protein
VTDDPETSARHPAKLLGRPGAQGLRKQLDDVRPFSRLTGNRDPITRRSFSTRLPYPGPRSTSRIPTGPASDRHLHARRQDLRQLHLPDADDPRRLSPRPERLSLGGAGVRSIYETDYQYAEPAGSRRRRGRTSISSSRRTYRSGRTCARSPTVQRLQHPAGADGEPGPLADLDNTDPNPNFGAGTSLAPPHLAFSGTFRSDEPLRAGPRACSFSPPPPESWRSGPRLPRRLLPTFKMPGQADRVVESSSAGTSGTCAWRTSGQHRLSRLRCSRSSRSWPRHANDGGRAQGRRGGRSRDGADGYTVVLDRRLRAGRGNPKVFLVAEA